MCSILFHTSSFYSRRMCERLCLSVADVIILRVPKLLWSCTYSYFLYISKLYQIYCGPQIGILSCCPKGLTVLGHICGFVGIWNPWINTCRLSTIVTARTKVCSKVQALYWFLIIRQMPFEFNFLFFQVTSWYFNCNVC